MISADEAKKLTIEEISRNIIDELTEVQVAILGAIREKKFSIVYEGHLTSKAIRVLNELNYKIYKMPFGDEVSYKIEWRKLI
ncbi:MAG TPA: hypothetical protein DCW90_10010 [Lachnospiraceae bacterium]|nr:hypothetical protein [Lachnospiraceae bacterium]